MSTNPMATTSIRELRNQIDALSRANLAAWEALNANSTTIAYCVAQIAVLEGRINPEVSRHIITDVRAPMDFPILCLT